VLGDATNAARVLHQIGNTHYLKGNHAAALESYRQSLDGSASLGDRSVSAATRIQIANVLYQTGNLEAALRCYVECTSDTRALGDPALVSAVELQLSRIHFQQGRYVEAEAHLREAEACAASSGDLRSLLKILETQALVLVKRREYDQARECHDKALRAAEALRCGARRAAPPRRHGTGPAPADAPRPATKSIVALESPAARGSGRTRRRGFRKT
jgi:tetratricopeptide (TPR) repeat protein